MESAGLSCDRDLVDLLFYSTLTDAHVKWAVAGVRRQQVLDADVDGQDQRGHGALL